MSEQTLPQPRQDTVYDRDSLRIHTFTSPEPFLANSTHIIETDNVLVLVDGQFVAPYAQGFRAYADSLGKPIERVFLSHAHVDHFFGLGAAFTDVPVHAPAATIATLRDHGEAMRAERAQQYGPLVPDRIVVPQHVVGPGTDVIDGLTYELDVVGDAECDAQLIITLPDVGVTVVQDLVYSGAHVYITRDTRNWVSVLRDLHASASDMFLAGHGPVADKAELARNIDYLLLAEQTLARTSDPAVFKEAMLSAFPERTGAVLMDIYLPRLFGTARQ